jgi:hypothetical protein
MKKTISLIILVLVVIFSLPLSLTALAQVQARIRIIWASNEGTTVDPSLGDVYSELGSLFNFTSYRLLRNLDLNLVGNKPHTVPLPGDRSMEVTLVGEYRKMAEIRLRILRRGTTILNTQVRLAPGRTVIVGGPRHEKGVAIFAISARF